MCHSDIMPTARHTGTGIADRGACSRKVTDAFTAESTAESKNPPLTSTRNAEFAISRLSCLACKCCPRSDVLVPGGSVRRSGSWAGAATVLALMVIGGNFATDAFGAPPARVLYRDTKSDPDDVPIDPGSCCQQDPDLQSSTRKVTISGARRALFITFRTYEALEGYWAVIVRLDTRGGPLVDAGMSIHDSGLGPRGCGVRLKSANHRRRGTLQISDDGDRATCWVPLRWVHPNKRIRWKLISLAGQEGSEPGVDDHAPDDRGWYE